MVIEGKYLDEILRKLYIKLLSSTDTFEASKGEGKDLLAPKILLTAPRARISATVTRGRLVSALAEFCWYLSGSADLEFIRFYIREYPSDKSSGSLEEAYGPRLVGTGEFGRSINQVERVIDQLKRKPDTRRAVISILEPSDLGPEKVEAPCTIALQFIRRRERLHLTSDGNYAIQRCLYRVSSRRILFHDASGACCPVVGYPSGRVSSFCNELTSV